MVFKFKTLLKVFIVKKLFKQIRLEDIKMIKIRDDDVFE